MGVIGYGRPTMSNILMVSTCLSTGQKTQGVGKEFSMLSTSGLAANMLSSMGPSQWYRPANVVSVGVQC